MPIPFDLLPRYNNIAGSPSKWEDPKYYDPKMIRYQFGGDKYPVEPRYDISIWPDGSYELFDSQQGNGVSDGFDIKVTPKELRLPYRNWQEMYKSLQTMVPSKAEERRQYFEEENQRKINKRIEERNKRAAGYRQWMLESLGLKYNKSKRYKIDGSTGVWENKDGRTINPGTQYPFNTKVYQFNSDGTITEIPKSQWNPKRILKQRLNFKR